MIDADVSDPPPTIHASAVAIGGRAVLIVGPSGAGKSGLALQLMAFGAQLVADDRTVLQRVDQTLWASAPQALSGLIEARGVGILNAVPCVKAPVGLVVDLSHREPLRLPPPRYVEMMGLRLVVLHSVPAPHFPAAIFHYMVSGRRA